MQRQKPRRFQDDGSPGNDSRQHEQGSCKSEQDQVDKARPIHLDVAKDKLPAAVQDLLTKATTKWLSNTEVFDILNHHEDYGFTVSQVPAEKPPGGCLFLFNRNIVRYFRKDSHNWRKKADGKSVRETHEKLKVGSSAALNCYYAHTAEDSLQRRCYWLLESDEGIVLVHYLNVPAHGSRISSCRQSQRQRARESSDRSVSEESQSEHFDDDGFEEEEEEEEEERPPPRRKAVQVVAAGRGSPGGKASTASASTAATAAGSPSSKRRRSISLNATQQQQLRQDSTRAAVLRDEQTTPGVCNHTVQGQRPEDIIPDALPEVPYNPSHTAPAELSKALDRILAENEHMMAGAGTHRNWDAADELQEVHSVFLDERPQSWTPGMYETTTMPRSVSEMAMASSSEDQQLVILPNLDYGPPPAATTASQSYAPGPLAPALSVRRSGYGAEILLHAPSGCSYAAEGYPSHIPHHSCTDDQQHLPQQSSNLAFAGNHHTLQGLLRQTTAAHEQAHGRSDPHPQGMGILEAYDIRNFSMDVARSITELFASCSEEPAHAAASMDPGLQAMQHMSTLQQGHQFAATNVRLDVLPLHSMAPVQRTGRQYEYACVPREQVLFRQAADDLYPPAKRPRISMSTHTMLPLDEWTSQLLNSMGSIAEAEEPARTSAEPALHNYLELW